MDTPSPACKTTSKPDKVVNGEGKRVELMGMDFQVDPYFVEPEGEDNDLFGNARDAAASAETAAAERDVDHRAAAADAETETAEARFLPGPMEPIQSQAEDHRASGHIRLRNLVQRMRALARHR